MVHSILMGLVPAGAKVPPSRALAVALGLSRNTVSLALQVLVDKGFLIAVAVLWCLIVLTLVCLFSKYRNLKYRYSQLGEEPAGGASNPNNMSQGGEIEM
jgi:DNA-binding transcriptional MocR family regulator